VVDPVARAKMEEGVYTGLSVGGDYGETWQDPTDLKKTRYVAIPSEASLADLPCNPDATFELVGADGLGKAQRFAPTLEEMAAEDDDPPQRGRRLTKSRETSMPAQAQDPEVDEAAQAERRALKKAKAEKWARRARKQGFRWKDLSKADRREFKQRHRIAREMKKLEKIVARQEGTLAERQSRPAMRAIVSIPDDVGKTGEVAATGAALHKAAGVNLQNKETRGTAIELHMRRVGSEF